MRSDAKTVVIIAVALLAFACGCQPKTHVPESLTQKLGGVEPDDQMEFWHELADKRMTSNDDAFRGLLLYMDGKDEATSYEDRVADLRSRKMLPKGFSEPADLAVSRGTLAVAITRLISLKGGVGMRLLGPTPRYAVRELMFVGVYPTSSPNQTFSGAEYVGIIGRVEDYQRGNPADVPAAVLPSEREKEKTSPPTSTLPPRRD